MKKAILSIEVDETNWIEVRFGWEPGLQLPLIWALKFAEKFLIEWIEKRSWISDSETWNSVRDSYKRKEEKLSKSDALGVYLKARSAIEQRIQAINKSSEKAEFAVNTNLLDIL
jgi:hypothetical protein